MIETFKIVNGIYDKDVTERFLKWVGHMEWFAVRVSTSTNSKEHWNIAG